MSLLIDFTLRLLPGLLLVIAVYSLLPRQMIEMRVMVLIFGFILMRDTMTPLGIWQFDSNDAVIWFRFIEDAFILLVIGIISLLISLIILYSEDSLRQKIKWIKKEQKLTSILMGTLSSVIIALPFILPYINIPIAERGGEVKPSFLLPLLIFCLLGNFLEEVLFRGMLQNYLLGHLSSTRALFISALTFAMGHSFLAITVTNIGPMILIFTLWEGLICSWLYKKYGLLSATLAHGLAIFIISGDLISWFL